MRIDDIAQQFGVTLCDSCGQPTEIHAGYDHRKGVCLIDHTGMMMRLGRRTNDDIADLRQRLTAFSQAVIDDDETSRSIGSGI